MKKRILSISFIVIALSLVLSSYRAGPGRNGWDCTGAETGLQNPAGCSSGGGCHAVAATPGILVVIELDSAGTAVTNYVGGKSYTVKLTGTNNTTSPLPGFGFQLGSIAGDSALVTPVNAGTWGTCPTQTHYSAAQSGNFVVNVVEQSLSIAATTGGGAQGSTYTKSFPWTAPAAGTGTISFWGVVNCVNNSGGADPGDLWNTAKLVVKEEDTVRVYPAGLNSLTESSDVKLYPNPVNDVLNLQWDNAQAGNYTVAVYNISGQVVASEKLALNNGSNNQNLNTSNWVPGIYLVNLKTENSQRVFRVVKQ